MDDPRLAAALLTSSPAALAGLFDAYGDRLFRYCWGRLRSRERAQVALRDTLLVARAHIARLADPEDPTSLAPWLYSLARAECRRHQAEPPAGADESPARLGRPVTDARLMSWNAAMSLEAAEFEALDLACRHYVDLGQVLGLPAAAAGDLLDQARQHLERALGAEVLARRGPACPDRDALLAGLVPAGPDDQPGPVTAEVRERVLAHADDCAACAPEVPRNVSAPRIFALLPAPALTPQDRTEILAALAGPVPPPAPALAPAALVPAPATSAALAGAVAGPGRSALGPPLASYVRVPAPPARVAGASDPALAGTGAPGPSGPGTPGAALAWNSGPSRAGSGPAAAPFAPAPGPVTGLAARQEAARPRRVHRGRLVIAGTGVLVSGVVIASAIAMAGPGQTASGGGVTPTLAAGAATGSALQSSGLSAAGPASSRAPAGSGTGRPAGTGRSAPPPLVRTAGRTNQVMITTATQPLPPDQAPGAQPDGGGPVAGTTAPAPGLLQLSASGVILGGGSAGQLTLTATGGTVTWSASANPPQQVILSSYGSTLTDGQRITVTVQVSRGTDAGSAAISFQVPGADTQIIPVTWSAQPSGDGSGSGSGSGWHHYPTPGPSPSPGTPTSSPPAGPSALGPR